MRHQVECQKVIESIYSVSFNEIETYILYRLPDE